MDERSCQESLRLWDVLERMGISEQMRQMRREISIREEILYTITNKMQDWDMPVFIFGSYIEGTATSGMNSDQDIVLCHDAYPVIDNIQQAPPGRSYLMVSDVHTKPGYVKLQVVHDGVPLTVYNHEIVDTDTAYDREGRVCMKHISIHHPRINEANGPAFTRSNHPGIIDVDFVPAYRSKTFPKAAMQSLLDFVRSGWLTGDDFQEMVDAGCLFVGIGHPASDETEIEWRISFSFQERQLMFSLNSTQHKCYVALKLVKCLLTSDLRAVKSITSYHCKTCLFNVIAKLRVQQWRPENLIDCTCICLQELLQCLYDSDCPNFFIRTNNMFELRVNRDERERLIVYIRELLQEKSKMFYRIRSENIGEMMKGNMMLCFAMEQRLCEETYWIHLNACGKLLLRLRIIYAHVNSLTQDDVERYLLREMFYVSSVDRIAEHSQEETKAATSALMAGLHQIYAQHLASQAFATEVPGHRRQLLEKSARHLKLGMTWNLMSGRLLYATILYRQGDMDLCCNLLEQMERRMNAAVTTRCACHALERKCNAHLMKLIQSSNADIQATMQSSIAPCIIFLPCQREIIPTAVQYELYRSLCTPPGSRDDELGDDWFDLAVVDSKVYLYLMQYLVYRDLNKPDTARAAYRKLFRVLMDDKNLGHRETGYNLLGWICTQEGYIESAAHCFLQSWILKPHHNAAKWHALNVYTRNLNTR